VSAIVITGAVDTRLRPRRPGRAWRVCDVCFGPRVVGVGDDGPYVLCPDDGAQRPAVQCCMVEVHTVQDVPPSPRRRPGPPSRVETDSERARRWRRDGR
jgi:hypothetical protein